MENFIDNFLILDFIAEGSFAKVFRCQDLKSGKFFALKRYSIIKMKSIKTFDQDTFEYIDGMHYLQNELDTIKAIKFKSDVFEFFPEFISGYENEKCADLVMEFSELGPPLNFNTSEMKYEENSLCEILETSQFDECLLKMTKCVLNLHSLKIAHLDLKIENFLFFGNKLKGFSLKLVDFNSSKQFLDNETLTKNPYGTIFYSPPEYYESLEGYDPFLADVYALGVCFFILLSKKLPFKFTKNENEINFEEVVYVSEIQNNKIDLSLIPQDYQLIVQSLMEKNPQKRNSLEKILELLFLKINNKLKS